MRNDLVVPYLITRFCLINSGCEQDKARIFYNPAFQPTLKRAYVHTYTNKVAKRGRYDSEEESSSSSSSSCSLPDKHKDNAESLPVSSKQRQCYNCKVTESPYWRKSTLNPHLECCNACGLYERHAGVVRPVVRCGDKVFVVRKTFTRRKRGGERERSVK